MKIKQSVINSFNRVGLVDWEIYLAKTGTVKVENRFGGGDCETTPFIAWLIRWVYNTNNDYDIGRFNVRQDDFDRIRYFIAEVDNNAYMTCLD